MCESAVYRPLRNIWVNGYGAQSEILSLGPWKELTNKSAIETLSASLFSQQLQAQGCALPILSHSSPLTTDGCPPQLSA